MTLQGPLRIELTEAEYDALQGVAAECHVLQAELAAAEAARQAAERRAAELAGALKDFGKHTSTCLYWAEMAMLSQLPRVRQELRCDCGFERALAASPTAALTADVLRAAEAWRDWNLGSEDPVRKPAQGLREAIDNWRAARQQGEQRR